MKRTTTLIAMFFGLALVTAAAAEKTEKAAAAAIDVSGIWNVSVEFSGGSGNPVFTLKQDGEKLTGHYAGALGEAEVTGTIKGRDITFGFAIAGQSEKVTYVGTVEGDTMKGRLTLGSFGEGTFTGKKQPKK
jgi:hypothetical protein